MNLDNRLRFLPLIFIDIMIISQIPAFLSHRYHSNNTDYSNIVALNETYSSCNQPDKLRRTYALTLIPVILRQIANKKW